MRWCWFGLQVGAREFFIASLFDKDKKLDLTAEERVQMEDAIAQGLGKDTMATYFSHRNTPPDSRIARVLRHTFRQDARRLEDSFNRTIGNECGGFEARNDEAMWISTTQETLHGGLAPTSPLEAWRQAGKPVPQAQLPRKRKVESKSPSTNYVGEHVRGDYDTGTHRVDANEFQEKARIQEDAAAMTDRTHHRPSPVGGRMATPLSARPSTSEDMRNRFSEWTSPTGRPASQGRSAGLALERNKGQGCLNMFWPMPPRRS